ncbi:hypothetical protein O4214_05290 [Rhodococcus erythropolis]|uniref:hypothetical protein n=1 Tax=Rhodococcus erythropolis TaxID=1833 RepID=UPI001E596DB8|nr:MULTISPECIES: hypothetical protein [Rhodococcus erythropolis group]MCD2104332.1 hypothetical protein [Rhodococcus qingshengii]MCZ4523387.1 hypothetical protein [Rhodococcus erythropolis]
MALRPYEQARLIYLNELIYQSEIVDAGIARIKAAISSESQIAGLEDHARNRQNLVELGAGIQSVLGAGALASKILRPVDNSGKRAKGRGDDLRTTLALGGDLLNSRAVRDSLEHYDERLDSFTKKDYNTFVMTSWMVMSQNTPLDNGNDRPILRSIDPKTLTVRLPGRDPKPGEDDSAGEGVTLSLYDLQAALRDVRRSAERALGIAETDAG